MFIKYYILSIFFVIASPLSIVYEFFNFFLMNQVGFFIMSSFVILIWLFGKA